MNSFDSYLVMNGSKEAAVKLIKLAMQRLQQKFKESLVSFKKLSQFYQF